MQLRPKGHSQLDLMARPGIVTVQQLPLPLVSPSTGMTVEAVFYTFLRGGAVARDP